MSFIEFLTFLAIYCQPVAAGGGPYSDIHEQADKMDKRKRACMLRLMECTEFPRFFSTPRTQQEAVTDCLTKDLKR